MSEFFGLPLNAAAHGAEIDFMILLVHWLMLTLFVGWGAFFVYALIRFRKERNPVADYVGTKSRTSLYTEGAVALFEAVLLVGFAVPVWAHWVAPHPAEANAVTVRVVGEQFAWNVHYPGPDGTFGRSDVARVSASNPLGLDPSDPAARDDVTTINQLHLPVNRPVTVLLSSKDVIHSFGLTYLRVKQDAIPGMEIPVHFEPILATPEESRLPGCAAQKSCWEIACAQLCGLGHYRMRGYLTVHEDGGFEEWLAQQTPVGGEPPGR